MFLGLSWLEFYVVQEIIVNEEMNGLREIGYRDSNFREQKLNKMNLGCVPDGKRVRTLRSRVGLDANGFLGGTFG